MSGFDHKERDPSTCSPVPHRNGLRVLIIRPSALGDVFRTAPALVALRRAMPDSPIDCLVREGFEDALRYHPAIDEVLGFPRNEFGQVWRTPRLYKKFCAMIRLIRETRYDLVFDFQGLARSGVLTRLTGAPRRVGFANAREIGWLGYNRRHHVDAALHHVDRLLLLLEAEGIAPSHDARLYVGPDDEKWCDALLHQNGWSNQPFACIGPTSQWMCKCWPIERFIEIGRRLLDSGAAGGRLAVVFEPRQRHYIQPMLDALPNVGGQARLMAPTTTVGQLMALIRRSSLVVANDSAVAHAAVGFDKPTVSIFGPTDPALVGPYYRDDAVVRPAIQDGLGWLGFYRRQRDDQTLISMVGVDEVWDKILDQLRTRANIG